MEPSPDVVVDRYIKYRDHCKKREKELADELAPYKRAMVLFEGVLSNVLGAANSMSFSTGTPYRTTVKTYSMADREAFDAFVREQNDTSFYASNVSKERIEQWIEENPDTPLPGLNVNTVQKVNVRRS